MYPPCPLPNSPQDSDSTLLRNSWTKTCQKIDNIIPQLHLIAEISKIQLWLNYIGMKRLQFDKTMESNFIAPLFFKIPYYIALRLLPSNDDGQ